MTTTVSAGGEIGSSAGGQADEGVVVGGHTPVLTRAQPSVPKVVAEQEEPKQEVIKTPRWVWLVVGVSVSGRFFGCFVVRVDHQKHGQITKSMHAERTLFTSDSTRCPYVQIANLFVRLMSLTPDSSTRCPYGQIANLFVRLGSLL